MVYLVIQNYILTAKPKPSWHITSYNLVQTKELIVTGNKEQGFNKLNRFFLVTPYKYNENEGVIFYNTPFLSR